MSFMLLNRPVDLAIKIFKKAALAQGGFFAF
jgi:hypothetical protein